MTRRNVLLTVASYAALAALVFGFAALRVKTQHRFATQTAPDELSEHERYRTPVPEDAKPFFSLVTNRTYGTGDRTRIWVNYRGLDSLDFRVYRVKDPVKFFRQLDNPHQFGEDEEAKVGEQIKRQPTFLENLRAFKNRWYGAIKGYVRSQLQQNSRKNFNRKFRRDDEDDEANRTPLNVADFARVPLLNESDVVKSWREKLPPLEDLYDRRMISLGRPEPGVYLVEAVHGDLRAFGVAVVSDLALVQKTTRAGDVLVYAVNRKSGAPREGVSVQVVEGAKNVWNGATDKQGILRFKNPQEQPEGEGEEGEEGEGEEESAAEGEVAAEGEGAEGEETTTPTRLITATAGPDFAISDLDAAYFGGYEGEEGGDANLFSYVYTDRPVYRPAQKIYFKGILRERTEGGYRLPKGSVSVTVDDPNGGRVYEQELTLSSRGTFSGELEVAEDAPLGSYNLTASLEGQAAASGYFEINEYKKPEYKVNVTVPQQHVNAGEAGRFNVSARYFFGAPVARADVKYYVYRSRYYGWWSSYEDGDEIDKQFGEDPTAEEGGSGSYGYYGDEVAHEGEGKLDAQGRLEVSFKVPAPDPKDNWDYTYRLEAEVTDPSRRTMSGSASFVGVRGRTVASAYPDKYVYYQGDTARLAVRARDYDGRPVQTRVKLSFVERRWQKVSKRTEEGYEYPDYELKERELSSATVETNAQGEAAYDYVVQSPGSIHIKTTVEENGRQITSEGGSLWAADRENRWTDVSYEGEETIKLVPDKKSYRPGETAHVLALLPTDGAHLLVTTELMSVMTVREVSSTGRSVILDIPIEPRYAPNVYLNVTYIKNGEMYTQEQVLAVPARDKLLNLEIIPNKKEFRPRETASYTLLARNTDGSPAAGAEVSFGVVDEAVYSITPESVEDIRRAFYGRRYNEVSTSFSVNFHFTGYAGTKPIKLAQNKKPHNLADFKNEGDMVNPRVRKLFKDTALWQPAVVTGADGKATVNVELPDNLTTWRATARAVTADTRVGVAVGKVVARKDLILRIAMPRFLTQGDTATLSAVVHNYLKSEKTTQISLDVRGGRLLDPPAQTVSIPSQGEHRINWRVAVPETGELVIVGKALTDTESDAVEAPLPVVPRGLKETRGETAALPEEDVEKRFVFQLPPNADQNARTLRLEFAPTIAGTLFGALDYLSTFPYGCTEQTMSSFLPNVIVAQTLSSVESASVKDEDKLDLRVRRGLRRLYAYQHTDGGWGWWKDDETDAFMTAYVVDGLTQAKRAGYEVDDARLDRARERLRALLDERRGEDKPGALEARAYMVYALAASGESDARYASELFGARGKLQPYGRALLALTLLERGDKNRALSVAAEIERTATADDSGAHWRSRNYSHGQFEYSNDVEATALSVKALARLQPQSQLLPRAARWLVMSRKHGRFWLSTKDTAFAIFGLTDYLKASQELDADFALEVYLNGEQVMARQVTGTDAASAQVFDLVRRGKELGGPVELRVVKRGRGVLYVTSTLSYHTNDEQVAAQGSPQLSLAREYLRLRLVPGENNTLKWQTEPLSGELRSGDMIVSRLRVEGQPGSYLLLEDPIPAGCEQVEAVGALNLNHTEKEWSSWYSAREFRDQRTALFLSYFDGKAMYQTAMRVQVPGAFRVAPARVEQMYQPTVRANTASASLMITDNK